MSLYLKLVPTSDGPCLSYCQMLSGQTGPLAARDGRHGLPTWLKLTLPGMGERRSRGGWPCVPVASSGSQLGMGDMAAYLVDVDSARGGREAQQRRAALCPSSQLR
jgi:hypothetical protein